MHRQLFRLTLVLALLISSPALAWHDATHMAVMAAAGLDNYAYLAVGPDMAKEKAGRVEIRNHYNNTSKRVKITPAMVLAQVGDYNNKKDADGHLYGAIIAAFHEYQKRTPDGKNARYHLGYAAHYLGDLSMPLHHIVNNAFNKANHAAIDGTVEVTGPPAEPTSVKVARLAAEIQKRMALLPPLQLPAAKTDRRAFNQALAQEIAAIANRAKAIGYAMQAAKPPRTRLTEEEAYVQLAQSARLLQAAYAAIER